MKKICLILMILGFFSVAGLFSAEARQFSLRVSLFDPPNSVQYRALDAWKKRVEKETNGQLKITIYAGQSLGKGKDDWNMVKMGISDITWILPRLAGGSGAFPLSDFANLPFVAPAGHPLPMLNKIWDKYVYKEWKDVIDSTNIFTGADLLRL